MTRLAETLACTEPLAELGHAGEEAGVARVVGETIEVAAAEARAALFSIEGDALQRVAERAIEIGCARCGRGALDAGVPKHADGPFKPRGAVGRFAVGPHRDAAFARGAAEVVVTLLRVGAANLVGIMDDAAVITGKAVGIGRAIGVGAIRLAVTLSL